MPAKDELRSVFEDARQHLESLPEWEITSETRSEIARLSATAKGRSETTSGRHNSSPRLKVKVRDEIEAKP